MNLAEIRENLRLYQMELEMFRYLNFLGRSPARPLAEIHDRFSDIFSRQSVNSLKNSLSEDERLTTTERDARRVLYQISRDGFLRKNSNEISLEIDACQSAFAEIRSTRENQRQIFTLYKEKISILNRAAEEIGFSDLADHLQDIAGIDSARFASDAEFFVDRSEQLVPLSEDEISENRYFSEDHFQGRLLRSFFRQILQNFDFPERSISQIKVKAAQFTSKVKLFSPKIPDQIFIYYPYLSGIELFASFLIRFGEANLNGWTSANLYSRYPEFVHPPANILRTGYGILFESLLEDEGFVRHCFRIEDETVLAHLVKARRSGRARQIRDRIAALQFNRDILVSGADIEEAADKLDSALHDRRSNRLQEFPQLLPLSFDNSDQSFLRGALFGYALREYLRSRYDFYWWKRRGCFDELIDMWNTASRYAPEELAKLIGFEPGFELLADSLK